MIKELTIKGKEFEAKGNFLFLEKAKTFAKKTKDGEEGDGITSIYTGLLQRKAQSILEFWQCVVAKDKSIKPEHVDEAITEIIEEQGDTIELIRGAVDVLDNSGFFKQETRTFWMNTEQSYKMAQPKEGETKEEARAAAKEYTQVLKDLHKAIMNPEEVEA